MANSNLQERSSRKIKNVLKGASAISALKFGLSLVFLTVFLVACPQPTPSPGPTLLPEAAAPMVEPANGLVANDAMLVITGGEPGATIRYTSGAPDVANPTGEGGMPYTIGTTMLALNSLVPAEGTFPKTVTVKVIAFKPATHRPSPPVTRTYMVAAPTTITLSESMLTLTEASAGRTGTYTVVLDNEPTADVTVTVMGADTSIATIDTNTSTPAFDNTLTFTPSGGAAPWDVEQTVTVTAVDNSVVGGTAMLTLTHTASGGGYAIAAADARNVTVTVTDDERAGVTITPTTPLSVDESSTGSYTVRLSTQPAPGTTVILTPSFGTSGVATVSPTVLYFDSVNWSTSVQTITVIPVRDADSDDETTTISYTVSANTTAGYNGLEAVGSVMVNVTDNIGVTITTTTTMVNENGTVAYTVNLTSAPTADVTVTPSASNATFNPTSLTFAPGDGTDTKTVTVTPVPDSDGEAHTITISHGVTGGDANYNGLAPVDIVFSVTDNVRAGLMFSQSSLTVNESAENTSYTVKLNTPPTANVTVTLTNPDSGAVTLSTTELMFTNMDNNWNMPQTVTVTPVRDSDTSDETIMIRHVASGGDYGSVTGNVTVTVDDDVVAGLVFSQTRLTVSEGTANTSYTVRLNTPPTADVTVTPTSSDTGAATVSGPLMFTNMDNNWNMPQTVTVTPVRDSDASDETIMIRHAASGGDYGSVTGNVTINVTDNNVPVTISTGAITVAEGGTFEYTVSLDTEPTTGAVIIDIDQVPSNILNISPTQLWFANANWSTPQTVTVRSNLNPVFPGDMGRTSNIRHILRRDSAGGATHDAAYYPADPFVSLPGLPSISVSILDDDSNDPGARLSLSEIIVVEGGPGVTYTVVLTKQPTAGPVQINVISETISIVIVDQTNLMFTVANWDEPQTVTVTIRNNSVGSNFGSGIRHSVQANVGGYTTGTTLPRLIVRGRNR